MMRGNSGAEMTPGAVRPGVIINQDEGAELFGFQCAAEAVSLTVDGGNNFRSIWPRIQNACGSAGW